jgi:hypothetical protein
LGSQTRVSQIEAIRIESPADLPARDENAIEVALLDMNCGYANVGHDAIVGIVGDSAAALASDLERSGRRVRVLSYAVRDKHMVPAHAAARHALYLGTGGPGHLDPRRNERIRGTEEIWEDPAWEEPLWSLFDAIEADQDAALYGVCHTFGLLCRWSGAAHPALRGPEKGGPMSGVGTNVLTPEALAHPWFARLGAVAPEGAVPVLDSRHYDLVPNGSMPEGATAIAFESAARNGAAGEALTMLEIARDPGGVPRIFAVNSHPEIGAAERVEELLARLLARGAIDREVFEQRSAMLPMLREERREARLEVSRAVFADLVHERLARLARA